MEKLPDDAAACFQRGTALTLLVRVPEAKAMFKRVRLPGDQTSMHDRPTCYECIIDRLVISQVVTRFLRKVCYTYTSLIMFVSG